MTQREPRLRVNQPPVRPTLIYDGECRFCLAQVNRWRERTGRTMDYLASSTRDVQERFPELQPQQLDRSLQFIDRDGCVYAGAHGALRAFDLAGRHRWLLRLYEGSRLCARLLELGYRCVAVQRTWLSCFNTGLHRPPRA